MSASDAKRMKLSAYSRDNKLVIGLRGPKCSGKSTVASYLCEEEYFKEFSFAEPLKKACESIFLFTPEQATDPILKETVDPRWGVTPREVYQVVGTDLFRVQLPSLLPKIPNSIWVKNLIMRIKESTFSRIVVSDVRFPDEIQALKEEFGAFIVEIDRPGVTGDISFSAHPSETALRGITSDFVIRNDGTIPELHLKVNDLFSREGFIGA